LPISFTLPSSASTRMVWASSSALRRNALTMLSWISCVATDVFHSSAASAAPAMSVSVRFIDEGSSPRGRWPRP
jgi:hypothetical protein